MVGLAFFRGDQLLVRQFFMRHHAEEPAMLAALSQVLGRHEAVVTFNGKSFDVPLLLTRYTANRQRPAVPACRSTWTCCTRRGASGASGWSRARSGRWSGRCWATSAVRDVPSWMIPDLYFRYLRGASPEPMARVFEHNLHDMLSLVTLACQLGRLLDDVAAVSTTLTICSRLAASSRISGWLMWPAIGMSAR